MFSCICKISSWIDPSKKESLKSGKIKCSPHVKAFFWGTSCSFAQQPIPGSERLQVLFEQWVSCAGHWRESSLYHQLRVTSKHRKRGARKWLTVSELSLKYGSMEVAQKIAHAKETDEKVKDSQVRPHPDCADPSLIYFLLECSLDQVIPRIWYVINSNISVG